MTDYQEEQSNEIEVLESIYPSEFQILDTEPHYKFKIFVKSDAYDDDDEDTEGAALDLIFKYTKTYPDEPPVVEILSVQNLEDEQLEDLKIKLEEQCSENLGMVMIFTLVSFSVEWLNNTIEEERRKLEEEEERQKQQREEIERKKFEGTRVTVESFLEWRTKFDATRISKVGSGKNDEKSKKLTGRELFLKDNTMNESDLSFLGDDTDEVVAVDESLFQDLEDLDLADDDDSNDEDYVPGRED